ncbi:phage tail tube protein [Mesorhizobium sp. KR9-304]|uniref:phage tail tube protein n=1 Tax=Mesorhizobium sp. KR9-304 TaxID=3156614 RepID=UPI0032B4E52B
MSLAEGVSARIAYKFYASATITPGTEPAPASDPGASSAQILRRVASTLSLGKDTYQSNEIRSDRQIADFRHGTKRVSGNVSGELSPLTYADWFEASFRGTWSSAVVTAGPTDFTSVAADNSTSKFTLGGGNPVTKGYRVGMIVQYTNLSDSDNNSKNFVILAFGGSNNREITVYPAPDTMTADTSFAMTSVGRELIVPATGHVSRKVAVEIYNEDVDVARLFTENRVGGFNINLPATGMSTVDFDVMGRNMTVYESGDAPFFTSPTAATTTGLLAAVNGLLRIGGSTVAVVTSASIQFQSSPSGEAVIGSNLVPEIFLGRAMVSGQMTAFFENPDLIDDFVNETEIEFLAYLTTTSAVNTPAMVIYLPRIKLGAADLQTQGEGGQMITLPFQALKYETAVATAGIENTTIQITDTQVT